MKRIIALSFMSLSLLSSCSTSNSGQQINLRYGKYYERSIFENTLKNPTEDNYTYLISKENIAVRSNQGSDSTPICVDYIINGNAIWAGNNAVIDGIEKTVYTFFCFFGDGFLIFEKSSYRNETMYYTLEYGHK